MEPSHSLGPAPTLNPQQVLPTGGTRSSASPLSRHDAPSNTCARTSCASPQFLPRAFSPEPKISSLLDEAATSGRDAMVYPWSKRFASHGAEPKPTDDRPHSEDPRVHTEPWHERSHRQPGTQCQDATGTNPWTAPAVCEQQPPTSTTAGHYSQGPGTPNAKGSSTNT